MRFWLTVAVMLLVAAVIRWRGGGPERAVAGALIGNFLIGLGNRAIRGQLAFDRIDPVMAAVDMATLLVLVWIALRANRLWPIFVASLQIIVITAHAAVMLYSGVNQVYWAMMAYAQYVQILILIVGTLHHIARTRRIGIYREWRAADPRTTA